MEIGNNLKETIQRHHRSATKIKDEKFNVEEIGDYDLVVSFSPENFKCAVVSQKLGRCVFFESFDFTKSLDKENVLEQCKIIFEEHHVLQAGFWKTVRCVVSDEFFMLIPKEFFVEKKAALLLSYNYPDFDARSKDTSFFNPNSGPVVSIYSVPKKLHTFLKKYYPKIEIQFLHELTCTLEGIINSAVSGPEKPSISAYVHNNQITIIGVFRGKIKFFNTFIFHDPQDAIYYILSVMEQLDIRGEKSQIDYYGSITSDSALFKMSEKYVNHVRLGERPKLFYYNFEFDEMPAQWHFETFSAYLCK